MLDGRLDISLIGPFVPAEGDTFTIITAPSVVGQFSQVNGPSDARVRYTPTSVVVVFCAADLAPPFGVLDFDDVLAFLVGFGNMEPVSDLAPPFGTFDFDDVLAFLTSFGAGCSSWISL